MGVNKVDLATGETLIDISNDTVTPQALAKGYTAHNSNGDPIVGTMTTEGGSGIIDVTELPTSGIDENAVYRLTETIQTEKTEIYFSSGGYNIVTLQEWLESMGISTVPNYYVSDGIPVEGWEISDLSTFSQINIYIEEREGYAFVFTDKYNRDSWITIGEMAYQSRVYDRGFTKNVYKEDEGGVYTTIEAFKDVARYFIRKNGKWVEITAYVEYKTPHKVEVVDVLSGDLTRRVYGASEILSGEVTKINPDWFLKKDGTYMHNILRGRFTASKLFYAEIPPFISGIDNEAFFGSADLRQVIFYGKVSYIGVTAFDRCYNLTKICVPWSENEVSGAPWGATFAEIHYNCEGDDILIPDIDIYE